jgi:hypothetical protein
VRWKHAITIRARPAEIWPWLVQMGCRRAGWYSYDGLDNGGVRSAERILPEFQQVQVGDIFPATPRAKAVWHPLDFGLQRRQLLNLKAQATCGGGSITARRQRT